MNFNQIKGVLIDVDGTLVNSQKEFAQPTRNAVKQLIKKGFKVGLCTGRSFPSLKNYILNDFPAESCHIVDDGGRLITQRGEDIFVSLLESDLVRKICFKALELDVDFGFAGKRYRYYSSNMLKTIQANDKWSKVLAEPQDLDDWSTASLGIYNLTGSAFKDIRVFLDQASFDKLEVVKVARSHGPGFYFKIARRGIDKGSTAQLWAQEQQLELDQIAMCGDSHNDVPIFKKNLGLRVAMGNAVDELKDLADIVIGHTDQNGLAKFLQKFMK
jgi:Cof subfamily protein (haloacid dehalogenase superfamily)